MVSSSTPFRSFGARALLSFGLLPCCLLAPAGCATSTKEPPPDTSLGGTGPSNANTNPGNNPSNSSGLGGSNTGANSSLGSITVPTMSDAGNRPTRCDDAGNCTCISIASIGHEGVWGPCSSDSTTAFQTWLNTQSTAHVDNYDTTKPTITAAFLAQYDVLILQWMVENGQKDNDGAAWVFTPDEVQALETWVKNGGGIIALNGYQCNGQGCTIYDTTATNQLLSFTDIQFNSDDTLDPTTGTSCQDCYCWGGSLPLGSLAVDAGGLPATVAPSTGIWNQSTPIGANINYLGSYIERSIKSTTATVDCADAPGAATSHTYAVHEQIGQGHVVAYGDEWITYSGEWTGTGTCLGDGGVYGNVYDPCYEKSAAQVFQIAQFWYNSIKYAASSVQCFTIMDNQIVR